MRHTVAEVPRKNLSLTAQWLCEAKRPLVVFGAGCRGHEHSMRNLVDVINAPFVTTPRAKGIVGENHPCSLRNTGLAASIWSRRYTADSVDACVVLGSDLDDASIGPTPYLGANGKLVHIDLDARVFGRNLPTALGIQTCVGAFADALAKEFVSQKLALRPDVQEFVANIRAESAFDVAEPERDGAIPIRPHRLLADIEKAVGESARFVSDIGEHMLFALHYLTARAPDAFYLQLKLGSMASGIAGSIGLALADRSKPVVCIAGDGGMQMAGMELLVAKREHLSILFVVFNDSRYNMVHHGMRQIFGDAHEYDMPPIDFTAWASSFGVPALTISRPGEITTPVIRRLLEKGGPALIDARIDRNVRVRGGGRVEALQQMSMITQHAGKNV